MMFYGKAAHVKNRFYYYTVQYSTVRCTVRYCSRMTRFVAETAAFDWQQVDAHVAGCGAMAVYEWGQFDAHIIGCGALRIHVVRIQSL